MGWGSWDHAGLRATGSLARDTCTRHERIASDLRRRLCRGHAFGEERRRPRRTGHFAARMASGPDEAGPLPHETILPQALPLLEWPALWHPTLDQALRGAGRPGRAGQSLLSHPRRGSRPDPRLRAALGG